VRAPLTPGQEVELLLAGGRMPKPLKRIGRVVWALLLPDGTHGIGVVLEKRLTYADLQRLARL
jgi:hypothetical protein